MKKFSKISALLGLTVLLAGTGTIAFAADGQNVNSRTNQDIAAVSTKLNTELSNIKLDFSAVKELDLNTGTGSIKLYEKEGISQIEVYIGDKDKKTNCFVLGNTLKIQQMEHRDENYAPSIEVLVPVDFQFEKVSLDTGMSDCEIKGISTSELEMDTGMGAVAFSGTVTGDVALNTGSGDVTLNLKGKNTNYNYTVNSGAGSIQIGETKYPSRTQHKTVDNRSSHNMDLSCAAGNITIAFTNSL